MTNLLLIGNLTATVVSALIKKHKLQKKKRSNEYVENEENPVDEAPEEYEEEKQESHDEVDTPVVSTDPGTAAGFQGDQRKKRRKTMRSEVPLQPSDISFEDE